MTKPRLSAWTVLLVLLGFVGLVAPATSASAASVSNCKPTAAHPYPVVLVHGTFGNSSNWDGLKPNLVQRGYCVSAFDYVSTNEIGGSARQLGSYVDQVLAKTGAKQVDIVGHSQGGMMPRYWMKFLGGASKVHHLIGIVPSNHGTQENGIAVLAGWGGGLLGPVVFAACQACQEQIQGSLFLVNLNSGGDTLPGVQYTVISTTHDEVVTPSQSAFLNGPSVKNLNIQDVCPLDTSGHIALALYDSNAWQLVYNALDPAHARPVNCSAQVNPL